MVLQISIEPNAVVCQSAKIELSSASDFPGDQNDTLVVRLTIGTGNIFHPNAQLYIVPPTRLSGTLPESNQDLFLSIGANNLFEEQSCLTFDLSDVSVEKHSEGKNALPLLGSYNQCLASSQIRCASIGNANIFHAKCSIVADEIKNGNIFQAYSLLQRNSLAKIDLQEKVIYRAGDSGVCKIRNHADGIQKNISEGSLLLRATRKIVMQHHRVTACKI
jgi:hypothetical protein